MRKFLILALTMLSLPVFADESSIHLKDGPGRDTVAAQCGICHSNDMILINSPFLDKKGWETEVNKMIQNMIQTKPV